MPPFFSIVIPTYNRQDRLNSLLQSLSQLSYPHDRFEVIVVDDGSHTSLEPIVEPFKAHFSLNFIRQPNAGPASARNRGAAAAKGEYLVFTDDDCQPDPRWLEALAEAIALSPNALIGGHTINALDDNIYSDASQLLLAYLYGYYNQPGEGDDASFFASNNFAMPCNLYQQLGGFDTSFPLAAGEDREFCDRWKHHQLPMRYAPSMQVKHFHKLSLTSFWRQHFNYGRGAFHFHRVRSQRQAGSFKVEPLKFYLQLVVYPFENQQGFRVWPLSGLFLLSQFANAAGFGYEKLQQKRIQKTASPASL